MPEAARDGRPGLGALSGTLAPEQRARLYADLGVPEAWVLR
ncbi:hypothetical protein [Streptomyces sp. NPDC019507]